MTDQEHYKYLFDVDEEVRPLEGIYRGSKGRVVFRENGKLGVVFSWDITGAPVLFSPHNLESV